MAEKAKINDNSNNFLLLPESASATIMYFENYNYLNSPKNNYNENNNNNNVREKINKFVHIDSNSLKNAKKDNSKNNSKNNKNNHENESKSEIESEENREKNKINQNLSKICEIVKISVTDYNRFVILFIIKYISFFHDYFS